MVEYDFSKLTPEERAELDMLLKWNQPAWVPLASDDGEPHPQEMAYRSQADELYYGGAAGGGKTDLLAGLALTQHTRSIIFRREFKQARAIVERLEEIVGHSEGLNRQDMLWRLPGRTIEIGACSHPGSEQGYQGRPHDFIGFDEITHFTLIQYLFLTTWLRTTKEGQRCRIASAGNPPMDGQGDWVIQHWSPWINDQHDGEMALMGELRWYARLGDEFQEVADATPIEWNGETIFPKSRTFIASNVDDNPYLSKTAYKATLQSLPEPMRSQMLRGDFTAGMTDDAFQVFPTAWVDAAIERWKTRGKPHNVKQTSLGVDPARGGNDDMVIAPRYGEYIGELTIIPGKDVPTGQVAAGRVVGLLEAGSQANVDAVGVGSSCYDALEGLGVSVFAVVGSQASHARDKTGSIGFQNKRAEVHWKFREMLDPSGGEEICLPPDQHMRAELLAARWKVVGKGIGIRDKDEVKKKLGRSPDRAEAVMYAFAGEGPGVRLARAADVARQQAIWDHDSGSDYDPHSW